MNLKHIKLFFACLSLNFSSEAQFLKKLKKKAEQVTERTVLQKTDEIISKKTEQAIDSVTIFKPKDKQVSKTKLAQNTKANQQSVSNIEKDNNEADLHLQASVQPFKTELGGAVTFTISVNNKGPDISQEVVSRVVIPNSYSITNISVTQGNYNQDTHLWQVGTLKEWSRAVMTIKVVVIDDKDLMTTGEIMSCSTQDPDSTPGNGIDTNGNGNIIDDKGDEDDGDGQDVVIGEVVADNNNSNNSGNNSNNNNNDNENSDNTNQLGGNNPNFIYYITTDIKLELKDGKDHIISYLDFDTMAMRMEYHGKRKNPDPVYWDQYGYIYSADKGQYVKVHFETFSNYMAQMLDAYTFFDPKAYLPFDNVSQDVDYAIKTINYNSQEIIMSMGKYPIIEWAYYYHPSWFEGVEGVVKETISCRGSNNCKRYLVVSGQGKGTCIVFDSEDYLAEIVNPDGAKAIYTYEEATVKLPNAVEYNFNTRN